MDLESSLSCNICSEDYNDVVRPRTLPCGHSYCGSCLTNSINSGTLKCPNCQTPYKAASGNAFPISYGMEALISEMRKANLGAIPKQESESGAQPSKSGSKMQKVLVDEKESVRKLIKKSLEMELDTLKYQDFIRQRKGEHENLLTKIYDLANRNEEMVKELEAEDMTITDFLKTGEENKHIASQYLFKCEIDSEKVEKCSEALEEWSKTGQMQLPNVKTVMESDILVKITSAALNEANKQDDVTDIGSVYFSKSLLSPMDKIEMIRGNLSLTNLRSKSREVLSKDQVYAIQVKGGQLRSARVSMEGGKFCLHVLKEEMPPFPSQTIKHSDLMGSLNTSKVKVFLDLSWDGCNQGRVHIDLSPETPLAKHFLMLCSGTLGPSYAHSNFLQVQNKGYEYYERVLGGDYEFNDGTGGAALFSGLDPDDDIYTRTLDPGVVCTVFDEVDGSQIAQFGILTGKRYDDQCFGAFGRVTDGLAIVKKAAQQDGIRSVKISNCGVILPF